MIINGLVLLIGLIFFTSLFWLVSKISILKNERDMWKESCFAITEMYNNMMLQNRIEDELHNIGNNNLPLPKSNVN
mgnify:CR=1 FL=1|tara:strand:+ start:75 stop:302 length:228 start_codon:yes stop_codon:yes gene_type:complete